MTETPIKERKTRILNLDILVPPTLTVIYQGQHHAVLPVNSEMWLKMLQQNEALAHQVQAAKQKKSPDSSMDAIARQQQEMIATINMLCEVCPTMPREDLMKMPLIPLQKFSEAVMSMMEEEMEESAGQQPGELTSSL